MMMLNGQYCWIMNILKYYCNSYSNYYIVESFIILQLYLNWKNFIDGCQLIVVDENKKMKIRLFWLF